MVCSGRSFLLSARAIQRRRYLAADTSPGRCLSQDHRRGHRYVQYRFRRERREPVHAAGLAEGESHFPYFLVQDHRSIRFIVFTPALPHVTAYCKTLVVLRLSAATLWLPARRNSARDASARCGALRITKCWARASFLHLLYTQTLLRPALTLDPTGQPRIMCRNSHFVPCSMLIGRQSFVQG